MNTGVTDNPTSIRATGAIPDLPEGKRTALAQEIAIFVQQGLAAGEDPVNLLSQRAMEFMVTAKALEPNGVFAQHFTYHLTNRINQALADPSLHVPQNEVAIGVENMLIKRRAEALQSADLLCDPDFIESLPQAAKDMAFGMSDSKLTEIARRLGQPNDPAGVDAPIHITGSAIGSQLLHSAMIDVYNPANGPLLQPLTQTIQHIMPTMPPERAQILARGWLGARHKTAVNATQAVAQGAHARMAAVTGAHNEIAQTYSNKPAAAPDATIQAEDTLQAGTVSSLAEREVK